MCVGVFLTLLCVFRGVKVCVKFDPPVSESSARFYTWQYRHMLAARVGHLATRVLHFGFGRDAREVFSPQRVGFCLNQKFICFIVRGATLSSRDASGSRRDCYHLRRELLFSLNSFLLTPQARFWSQFQSSLLQ